MTTQTQTDQGSLRGQGISHPSAISACVKRKKRLQWSPSGWKASTVQAFWVKLFLIQCRSSWREIKIQTPRSSTAPS
eukprot:3543209-Rhodomonas_salina.1